MPRTDTGPPSFFAEACAITSIPHIRLNPSWTLAVGDLGPPGEFPDCRRGSPRDHREPLQASPVIRRARTGVTTA